MNFDRIVKCKYNQTLEHLIDDFILNYVVIVEVSRECRQFQGDLIDNTCLRVYKFIRSIRSTAIFDINCFFVDGC